MSSLALRRAPTLSLIGSLVWILPALASAPALPTFQLEWGFQGTAPGSFNSIWGMAADAQGNVYVVDQAAHNFQKFDRLGNYIWGRGGFGAGAESFDSPSGIALDPSGNLYVADTNNNRIQRFTGGLYWSLMWGTQGNGNGQFNAPTGVATDAAGNVYVADRLNHRIQKFSSTGAFITKWGSLGAGDGQFNQPVAVAIDGAGNVYVNDYLNSRIQKFSGTGAFITKWGSSGAGNGQFTNAFDVAADPVGNVYVADAGNNRVQKFTSSGVYINQWGSLGAGDGQFFAPRGVTVDAAGNVYVADTGNRRVQKFSGHGIPLADVAPSFLFATGTPGAGDGQFNGPSGAALHYSGNVYVTDTGNNRIQYFSSTGAFISRFGSSGGGLGQFNSPVGIAFMEGSQLVVVDAGNNRIQLLASGGNPIAAIGSLGSGPGQFNSPHGVATGQIAKVYVTDYFNDRVQIFTYVSPPNLVYTAQFGTTGIAPGYFSGPSGIATDRAGNIYVTEWDGNRVQKFDVFGNFITQWGSYGTGPGQFNGAIGVTVDASMNVYVSDYFNNRVQKFTSNGLYLSEVSVTTPRDPAVDATGNLYVPESSSHRVSKFMSPGRIELISDIGGDQGGQTRLRVSRSSADAPGAGTTIARYDVFRRIDPIPGSGLVPADDPAPQDAQLAGWDQVGTFSAYGESEYNVVVPTLVNSNASSLEYTTYMVRTATTSPFTYYDSAIDYGYSVDNLSPGTPIPFTAAFAAGATHLHWVPSTASDFATFRLYRGTDAGFVPGPANMVTATIDTGYVDPGPAGRWYKLAAVDFNGNESIHAVVGPAQTVEVAGEPAAIAFGLEEPRPNPVTGSDLVVRFALADAGRARLELIDVTGRRVLEREVSGAGRHVVQLGRERHLPAGLYLVKLTQGASTRVRRAIVLD